MTIAEKRGLRDAALTRILEIDAELAEMRRMWAAEGIQTPYAKRARLDAERTRLNLKLHQLRVAIRALEKEEKELKKAKFSTVLVSLLIDRGHGDLVREAERASLEAIITPK